MAKCGGEIIERFKWCLLSTWIFDLVSLIDGTSDIVQSLDLDGPTKGTNSLPCLVVWKLTAFSFAEKKVGKILVPSRKTMSGYMLYMYRIAQLCFCVAFCLLVKTTLNRA